MTVVVASAPPQEPTGYETAESDEESKDTKAGSNNNVLAAFAQVRALMWRKEWLKKQIELMSSQRDLMLENLNRVRKEKSAKALVAPQGDLKHGWFAPGSAEEKAIASAAAADAGDAQETQGGGEESREGRCARMEAWGAALVGRRQRLVQSQVTLSNVPRALAPLSHAQFHAAKKHKSHHHSHHKHGSASHHKKREPTDWDGANDAYAKDASGVERKLVTSNGQKLIIKFSGKADQQGSARPGQMSPALGSRPGSGGRVGISPGRPGFVDKRPHKALALSSSRNNSPRLGPSTPTTPRSDWGLDDYVYGGPRTHTKIETVQAKEIQTPKWIVLGENTTGEYPGGKTKQRGGISASSSQRLTSKPKISPMASFGSSKDGESKDDSSSENTDDETYLTRHRPYEEQEIRFRYPKLVERERKYKEALRREGLEVEPNEPEDKYKSLWYTGRKDDDFSAAFKRSEQSSGDERSPRPPGLSSSFMSDTANTPESKEPFTKARSPRSQQDSPAAALDTSDAQTPAGGADDGMEVDE